MKFAILFAMLAQSLIVPVGTWTLSYNTPIGAEQKTFTTKTDAEQWIGQQPTFIAISLSDGTTKRSCYSRPLNEDGKSPNVRIVHCYTPDEFRQNRHTPASGRID